MYEESCKNVYFKLSIYKNDKKVNITALKKIANFDIKKDRKEKLLKLKSVK